MFSPEGVLTTEKASQTFEGRAVVVVRTQNHLFGYRWQQVRAPSFVSKVNMDKSQESITANGTQQRQDVSLLNINNKCKPMHNACM